MTPPTEKAEENSKPNVKPPSTTTTTTSKSKPKPLSTTATNSTTKHLHHPKVQVHLSQTIVQVVRIHQVHQLQPQQQNSISINRKRCSTYCDNIDLSCGTSCCYCCCYNSPTAAAAATSLSTASAITTKAQLIQK